LKILGLRSNLNSPFRRDGFWKDLAYSNQPEKFLVFLAGIFQEMEFREKFLKTPLPSKALTL